MVQQSVRRLVQLRAGNRCEYCGLSQELAPASFHNDHIIARRHHGGDEDSNLALACYHCNRHKGPNVAGIDPDNGEAVALFHPRRQQWSDHFQRRGIWIIGLIAEGLPAVRQVNCCENDTFRRFFTFLARKLRR